MHVLPPIAIIGIGCRLPGGAHHPQQLWELLCQGVDGIVEVPKTRWESRRFYDPDPTKAGKMAVNRAGFLQQSLDAFDAAFFHLSPREADRVDPQQRLLLETSWEALEDAGLSIDKLKGTNTGVFIGAFTADWQNLQNSPHNVNIGDAYTGINASQTIISARLSYFYDFKGPCMTIDTACSSSLVSVHLACQSIWNGECRLAMAGGVNAMLQPGPSMAMSKGRFLNPQGQCRSFDADAQGYVRGEGAGVVILKPLEQALADGDPIYALIRSSGVNHDGRTQGLATPNGQAQKELILSVWERGGVNPSDIQYIEAHGTGTPIGDPIEAWAIDQALQEEPGERHKCLLGSIKTNIGHLEAAAGVVGLIKTALCLKHRKVPPNLHFAKPNPHISFDKSCLEVVTEVTSFPEPHKQLYAGVNAFGYGGTNAHVVMQEYSQEILGEKPLPKSFPFLLSANGDEALLEKAKQLAVYLETHPDLSMHDLAYTLYHKRQSLPTKLSVIAKNQQELWQHLKGYTEKGESGYAFKGEAILNPRVAFVYTGMGPQWYGMGRELLMQEPTFRLMVEKCDGFLQPLAGWSLLDELIKDESLSKMSLPQYAQPANFALQVALTQLLNEYGVVPQGVVGHSIGEVAAAYVAGSLTLEEGVWVSYHRSRIQSKRQGLGTMLAVEISEDRAQQYAKRFPQQLYVAAVNNTRSLTLSGDETVLQTVSQELEAEGIFNRFLKVDIAYHSGHMDGLETEVTQIMEKLSPQIPEIPFYSTVNGSDASHIALDGAYWWDNIRQPVLFQKAMNAMISKGYNVFVEIGPHPVLGNVIRDILYEGKSKGASFYTLSRREVESEAIVRLLGRLQMAGIKVHWDNLSKGTVLSLPTYPWQRVKHWAESGLSKQYWRGSEGHPMLAQRCQSPEAAWTVEVNRGFFPWLTDHCLDGSVVFPGAGYVEAALALNHQLTRNKQCLLEDINFFQPLVVGVNEPLMKISNLSAGVFQVHALDNQEGGEWTLHASGKMSSLWKGYDPLGVSVDAIRARCGHEISAQSLYEHFKRCRLEYGPSFCLIQSLFKGVGEALAEIKVPVDPNEYLLPPNVLDAALQTMAGVFDNVENKTDLIVPVHLEELHFFDSPKGKVWCHAVCTGNIDQTFTGDFMLYNEMGKVLVEGKGVSFRLLPAKQDEFKRRFERKVYKTTWEILSGDTLKRESMAGQNWQVICPVAKVETSLVTLLIKNGARVSDRRGEHCQVLFYCPETPNKLDDKCISVFIDLIQNCATLNDGQPCTVWVVTKGVHRVLSDDEPCALQSSALWGLVRVLRHEMPLIDFRLVDLAMSKTLKLDDLMSAISCLKGPIEVAVRGGKLYSPRLQAAEMDSQINQSYLTLQADKDTFTLELSKAGSIENLHFRESEERVPGPKEVGVRVHTTSLNFKDLMKVLGLLDQKVVRDTYFGQHFGMECSGTITSLGEKVKGYKVGDKVCVFVPNTFCSHLTVSTDVLCPIPPGLSLEQAPIYIPFITVLMGLRDKAQLKKGETILIHTATGAVGMAAIQYAKHIGAHIIATAGSQEKRDYLHALGIDMVADSRSLLFARQVKEWTQGRGADVVLNALTGEALFKSWELLAPYGRFIEIGKRDISQNSRLPMDVFQRNTLFAAIDLDRIFIDHPKIIQNLLKDTIDYFEEGVFSALPCKTFPAAQIQEAFQHMARAKHIGKVMVQFEGQEVKALPRSKGEGLFKPDATYLVTGGTSGFGLATAKWIAAKGGKHLLLLGRKAVLSDEVKIDMQHIEDQGVEVEWISVDVGNKSNLNKVLSKALAKMPPLKGVFHGAMVLDDGLMAQMNEQRFESVMHPKVKGCWNLHNYTQEMELDYFVMYSSISSLIGNPGQSNYSAANAFLDTFANYRGARGLPALVINWGAIADTGVLARDSKLASYLESHGIRPMPSSEALEYLEYLLKSGQGQYGVMDVDWTRVIASLPGLKEDSKFAGLQKVADKEGYSDFEQKLRQLDEDSQLVALMDFLSEKVASTLKMDVQKVDHEAKLSTMGVDSLMAMELQHVVEQKLSCKIPTMELMKGPSIKDLSKTIHKLLK